MVKVIVNARVASMSTSLWASSSARHASARVLGSPGACNSMRSILGSPMSSKLSVIACAEAPKLLPTAS